MRVDFKFHRWDSFGQGTSSGTSDDSDEYESVPELEAPETVHEPTRSPDLLPPEAAEGEEGAGRCSNLGCDAPSADGL